MTLTASAAASAPATAATRDPGSFRDPSGGVLTFGDQILRFFRGESAAEFRTLLDSGVLSSIDGVIASEIVSTATEAYLAATAAAGEVDLLVRHPRLPFVSYPYDWPFEMLRDAALLQLDVLASALAAGYIVKDATPYNVQFLGPKPMFIDVASFERYQEGAQWAGYAQFCRMFLNPLLLQARRRVPFHPWLRWSLDGIDPGELSRLLGFREKLRPAVFVHVVMQAWLNRRFQAGSETLRQASSRPIPKSSMLGVIRGLRKTVAGLRRTGRKSTWSDYEENLPYAGQALSEKERFVDSAVAGAKPHVLWDLGCNRGRFSLIAARHADYVVAMDNDEPTVGALYDIAGQKHPNVLPLVVDLSNPDPDQGWAQTERKGLGARGPADYALALALIHHLAISGNVPLPRVVDWLSTVTRAGVVEFVPKADPMVQRLLVTRKDVYPNYTAEAFETALASRFRIEERHALPDSARILYRFGRD